MVERIWALLNKKVSRYGPFQNADELRAATQRAWAEITIKEVNDVCRGFESQVEAIFSKNGEFCKGAMYVYQARIVRFMKIGEVSQCVAKKELRRMCGSILGLLFLLR